MKNAKVFTKDVYIKVPVQVTLDSEFYDEAWLEEFSKHFYQMDQLDDLACHIAQIAARTNDCYVEGVGYPVIEDAILNEKVEMRAEKNVTVKVPYFKYDDWAIGDDFLESSFDDCR